MDLTYLMGAWRLGSYGLDISDGCATSLMGGAWRLGSYGLNISDGCVGLGPYGLDISDGGKGLVFVL